MQSQVMFHVSRAEMYLTWLLLIIRLKKMVNGHFQVKSQNFKQLEEHGKDFLPWKTSHSTGMNTIHGASTWPSSARRHPEVSMP